MQRDRRIVLAVSLALAAIVAIAILRGLVGTIFFAITVGYVLLPVTDRLRREGLPAWWAAAVATAGAFVFGVALFVPIGAVLYLRRRAALGLIRSLPDSLTLTFGDFVYVIDAGEVTTFLARQVTQIALSLARATPVLAAKLFVFGLVLFALLYRGDRLQRALLGPVPDDYHDLATALNERVQDTLVSLYVIQAVTAIATFAVALAVFLALGIRYPVTLAVVAGLLQFLPVVGPSLVIAAIALGEYLAGDLVGAVVIAVVGLVFVGFLPDAILRPRLARQTTELPGSLYFVGFTGGLLSLGPVGIVAGPLAVALVVELLAQLANEVRAGAP